MQLIQLGNHMNAIDTNILIRYLTQDDIKQGEAQKLIDDSGVLVWISEENGKEAHETSDPQSGFWPPVSAWFISLFPVEEQI